MAEHSKSRRDFVKKAVYISPAILTLAAAPAYAKAGSQKDFKAPKEPKPSKKV